MKFKWLRGDRLTVLSITGSGYADNVGLGRHRRRRRQPEAGYERKQGEQLA